MPQQRQPTTARASGRPLPEKSVGRDAIVLSTIELLKEVSPDELTMGRAAEAAGVTRQLVRYYFSSLDGLLGEVVMVLIGRLQDRMAVDAGTKSSLRTKILSRLTLRFNFSREHPNFERLAATTIYARPNGSTEVFDRIVDHGLNLTLQILDGQSARAVDPRHLHLLIQSVSSFLEAGRPMLEKLLGSGEDGARGINRYLEMIADATATYLENAPHGQTATPGRPVPVDSSEG